MRKFSRRLNIIFIEITMNYVGKQACHMGASMSNNISGRWCKSFEIQLFMFHVINVITFYIYIVYVGV